MTDHGPTTQTPRVQAQDLLLPEGEEVAQTPDFQAVFEAQFSYVWRALRRLGVRDRDLEDLTHDVFLHVYRHLEQYEASRPLRPWLFGFAFRVASAYRRLARNRFEVLGQPEDPVDPAPTALERLMHAERIELANAALEQLELGRRAVFILHELDGQPIPEVARALGIPVNTAYSRLRVARQQFAASLQRLCRRRGEP